MNNLGSANPIPPMNAPIPDADKESHISNSSDVPSNRNALEARPRIPWLVLGLIALGIVILLAVVEGVVGDDPRPTDTSPQEVGPTRDDPARRTAP